MEQSVFKPKYTPLIFALALLYAAPWLYSIPNALFGRVNADWKAFWLLSGTAWALAGLLQMKSALMKKIEFGRSVSVEMVLQKPFEASNAETIHIFDDTIVFSGYIVFMRYFSNASDLLRQIKVRADKGTLHVVYDESGKKDAGWSIEKNLLVLIVFSLYMMLMLTLRIHPFRLFGIATDSLLLGWAMLLPVIASVRLFRWVRERTVRRVEAPRWI